MRQPSASLCAALAALAAVLLLVVAIAAARRTEGASVSLPRAGGAEWAVRGASVVVLAQRVQDGKQALVYRFGDGGGPSRAVSGPREIYAAAASRIAREPAAQFVIRAERSVRFERIDEILDTLREARVQHVLLQTERP